MKNLLDIKVWIIQNFSLLIISISTFLIPVKPLILLVGVFVLADTILGMWKANKLGERITSRKLSEVVSKTILYEGAVLLAFIIDTYLLGEFTLLFTQIPLFTTKIITATICYVEFTSLNENVKIISGFNLWESFRNLVRRASYVKDEFGKLKKNDESKDI